MCSLPLRRGDAPVSERAAAAPLLVQTNSVVECLRRGWSRRRSGSRRAPAARSAVDCWFHQFRPCLRRGSGRRLCPVGEALGARIGAHIVVPPHQMESRGGRAGRGRFHAWRKSGRGSASRPPRTPAYANSGMQARAGVAGSFQPRRWHRRRRQLCFPGACLLAVMAGSSRVLAGTR
jgi:hypothetical protein